MHHVKTIATSLAFVAGLALSFFGGWLARAVVMEDAPAVTPETKPEPPLLTDEQVRMLGIMIGAGVDRGVRAGVRDAVEKATPWVRPAA